MVTCELFPTGETSSEERLQLIRDRQMEMRTPFLLSSMVVYEAVWNNKPNNWKYFQDIFKICLLTKKKKSKPRLVCGGENLCDRIAVIRQLTHYILLFCACSRGLAKPI